MGSRWLDGHLKSRFIGQLALEMREEEKGVEDVPLDTFTKRYREEVRHLHGCGECMRELTECCDRVQKQEEAMEVYEQQCCGLTQEEYGVIISIGDEVERYPLDFEECE